MDYIIFDLEATCEENNRNFKNEIIEIGAIKINHRGETIGVFSKFAKPSENTKLTEFCKELTSISQDQIDLADPLESVLIEFQEWIGDGELISWGAYDINQIERDVTSQGIKHLIDITSLKKRHTDFKRWYAELKGVRPCGMKKALSMEKMELTGTHHRGIDDARNIAKIFVKYLKIFRNDYDRAEI